MRKLFISGWVSFFLVTSLLLNTAAEAKIVRISDSAWADNDLPIPLLHLEGSIETIIRDHAKYASQYGHGKETLEFLGNLLEKTVNQNAPFKGHPWLQSAFRWANRHIVTDAMVDHIPESYEIGYKLLAAELGLNEEIMWNALTLSDAALWYLSIFRNVENKPEFPKSYGCSSVIWDSGPESVLHGRNLDYAGVGYWDAHPLILHIVPKEGLAHIAITSAGVHAPGITAMNEAGLTLAIHQMANDDVTRFGAPVSVISAEVIRNARTIDDAINIIKSFSRAGSWIYVLSQGHDRASVETTAKNVEVRRSSDKFFFQTNHSVFSSIEKSELYSDPGVFLDSFERGERINEYKKEYTKNVKNSATPEKIIKILSDHARPDGKSVVAGGTVAKLENIQSLVFEPSKRRMWIALGAKDSAPNESEYAEYRWSDLRSPNLPQVGTTRIKTTPLSPLHAALRKLIRDTVNQKAESVEALSERRSADLEKYLKTFEEEGVKKKENTFGTWAGLYMYVFQNLKTSKNIDAKEADRLFKILETAMKDGDLHENTLYAKHRRSLGMLFLARLSDLKGERDAALRFYKESQSESVFDRVRKKAEEGTHTAYTADDTSKLSIDWAAIDLLRL